jgi:hypothetical protein
VGDECQVNGWLSEAALLQRRGLFCRLAWLFQQGPPHPVYQLQEKDQTIAKKAHVAHFSLAKNPVVSLVRQ